MVNSDISKAYESIEIVEKMLRESGVEQSNPSFGIGHLASLHTFKERVEYCRQNLKFLGWGSSRIAFLLPNGHALKLAWNRKGVAQNQAEGGDQYVSGLDCFAKTFSTAEDFTWIESEFARKCSKSEFKSIMGFPFEVMCDVIVMLARQRGRGDEFGWWKFTNYELAEKLISESEDDYDSIIYSINDYIGNYMASGTCADFLRIANWGIVNRHGKDVPVIVDCGFTNNVARKHYHMMV